MLGETRQSLMVGLLPRKMETMRLVTRMGDNRELTVLRVIGVCTDSCVNRIRYVTVIV